MNLFGTIGTSNPEYLLADPNGCHKIAIPCEPGNGTVKRGTIMYRKANGMFAPAAAANAVSTSYLAVLDETVDTDANLGIAEDAAAYQNGRLIAGKVTLASDGEVTAAIELVLRQQGITLCHTDGTAPVFVNGKIAITYKANGGTGEDVTAYADEGSSYSIAANSFTAPSSKTFSKWNTASDGTGTDYTAAASYTANANLTLYAIWA